MNESDKELLELSAKTLGLKLDKSPCNGGGHSNDGFDGSGNAVLNWYSGETWNPLHDNGDAFRLLAGLGLWISRDAITIKVRHFAGHYLAGPFWIEERADSPDPYAATRRAIVRAAAEIGKALP